MQLINKKLTKKLTNKMKIHYTLSSKVNNKTGKSEIMIRLIASQKAMFRAPAGLYIHPNLWDEKKEMPKTGKKAPESYECDLVRAQLNRYSELIIEEARKHIDDKDTKWLKNFVRSFEIDGKEITAKSFVNDDKTVDDIISEFIELQTEEGKLSSVSNVYIPFLHIWQRYDDTNSIMASEIDSCKVNDFICWYSRQGNYCANYITTFAKRFETIWRRMSKFYDYLNKLDVETSGQVYGSAIYLTKDERNMLYHSHVTDALDKYKDMFVLQCLIGCRLSDLKKLRMDNIQDGCFTYIAIKTAHKTPKTIRVPIHPIAQEIVDKYNDGEFLLPFAITNSDVIYNRSLKLIFKSLPDLDKSVVILDRYTRTEKIVKLHEIVSSHMARRTFIGCLHEEGFSEFDICSMSGHQPGSLAINRYRAVSDERKRKMIDAL